MSKIKQEYIKNTNNEIISPITSIESVVGGQPKILVAETVLPANSNTLEVNGLDIIRDGGIYDIIIAEFDTGIASSLEHVLRINDISSGYKNTHMGTGTTFAKKIDGTTFDSEATTGTNMFYSFYSKNAQGLVWTNGFGGRTNVFYTIGTLIRYDSNWITFSGSLTGHGSTDQNHLTGDYLISLWQTGALNGQSVSNINSLKVVRTTAQTGQIGKGSYIKVYKRI